MFDLIEIAQREHLDIEHEIVEIPGTVTRRHERDDKRRGHRSRERRELREVAKNRRRAGNPLRSRSRVWPSDRTSIERTVGPMTMGPLGPELPASPAVPPPGASV